MKDIQVKQTIVINVPVETIFAYMSNLENLLDWSSAVISVEPISPGGMRLGAMAKSTIRFLGIRMEMVFQIVECIPGRFLTIKSISGATPCILYYQFETLEDGGTCIAQDTVISFFDGLATFMEQTVGHTLRRFLEHDLLTLKDTLEIDIATRNNVAHA